MTELRSKFEDQLTLLRVSPSTRVAYIGAVKGLTKFYNQSPEKLKNEQIQKYLIHLIQERQLAWSSVNVALSGLKCFYRNVLKWSETDLHIPPQKRSSKLPTILSIEEVIELIKVTKNLKHRVMLMAVYGAGLRVAELVALKPEHIESSRMMIRVEQGKGRKDRYTLLPQNLLEELRLYWRSYNPKIWLFPGRDNKHISVSSAQRAYNNAKKKAGININKGRGIHTLRHCFATHLLEQGVDIYRVKDLLGHKSIKTTMMYLHLSKNKTSEIKSPLDSMPVISDQPF